MQGKLPKRCVVVGAGTMGPGMAVMLARAGCQVRVVDVKEEMLIKAAHVAQTAVAVLQGAGVIGAQEGQAVLGKIAYTASHEEAVRDAEFILEAVPEKLEIKQAVFAQLEELAPDTAILASNTSGIPITKLQEGRTHPNRIVGMHWSNPPHVIPVIEVIRGEATDDQAVAVTRALTHAMGYVPVTVKRDVAGFVENRILYAVIREALHLLEEDVASAEDIDLTVRWGIGFKLAVIGPLALLDVAGLDIYHSVASYLNRELDSSKEVSKVIQERVKEGKLGFKTGEGLFSYEPSEIPNLMRARVALLLNIRKEIERASHPPAKETATEST